MGNQSINVVEVGVITRYLREQSDPGAQRFAFAYTVHIRNHGNQAVQLIDRRWLITDGNGKVREVVGDGVVGEQPLIQPGAEYTYSSGCLLDTPVGSMEGHYGMLAADGSRFNAQIQRFRLAMPNALN
ncbi:MAG: Co2+/Mg2+ efflux protein ApaG [Gammaproteobacteria bacterium HGW-Gammaproteobacteria-11]|nr:MAG: Co2+/Mg2+ efflux protein ApaG [Gammaproteobacteria bacterium HGW-Gammaproteobacteria-11]